MLVLNLYFGGIMKVFFLKAFLIVSMLTIAFGHQGAASTTETDHNKGSGICNTAKQIIVYPFKKAYLTAKHATLTAKEALTGSCKTTYQCCQATKHFIALSMYLALTGATAIGINHAAGGTWYTSIRKKVQLILLAGKIIKYHILDKEEKLQSLLNILCVKICGMENDRPSFF